MNQNLESSSNVYSLCNSEESSIVDHSKDAFAPVAYLKLERVSLKAKQSPAPRVRSPRDFVSELCGQEGEEEDHIEEENVRKALSTSPPPARLVAANEDAQGGRWFRVLNLASKPHSGSSADSMADVMHRLAGELMAASIPT